MDLEIDQRGARPNRWSVRDVGLAGLGLQPVAELHRERDMLLKRRAGKITTQAGRLRAVHGRHWPYASNGLQIAVDRIMRPLQGDTCELYWHQPLTSKQFLAISYMRSGRAASPLTCIAATIILDEIARLKQSDAAVCHVTNDRISDRLLARFGWQQHCLSWRGRHFIKRYYGVYPEPNAFWRKRLNIERTEQVDEPSLPAWIGPAVEDSVPIST